MNDDLPDWVRSLKAVRREEGRCAAHDSSGTGGFYVCMRYFSHAGDHRDGEHQWASSTGGEER